MSAQTITAAAARPYLFLADDPTLWDAADAASLVQRWHLLPLDEVSSGGREAHPGDVVVVGTEYLAGDALQAAARLARFAPARVLLAAPSSVIGDVVGRALRLGVDDVVTEPVRPEDLRLRLEVLGQRPRAVDGPDPATGELLHELTNVLAAMRLTGFVVGRLQAPAGSTDGRLQPTELAARLDREVAQAVDLVGRVGEAVGGGSSRAAVEAPWR